MGLLKPPITKTEWRLAEEGLDDYLLQHQLENPDETVGMDDDNDDVTTWNLFDISNQDIGHNVGAPQSQKNNLCPRQATYITDMVWLDKINPSSLLQNPKPELSQTDMETDSDEGELVTNIIT